MKPLLLAAKYLFIGIWEMKSVDVSRGQRQFLWSEQKISIARGICPLMKGEEYIVTIVQAERIQKRGWTAENLRYAE